MIQIKQKRMDKRYIKENSRGGIVHITALKHFTFILFFLLLTSFVLATPCQENQQRQCGVSDVGACSFGMQICQGGEWSVCFGNVDPEEEQCNNGQDDNCNGQVDEGCLCAADTVRDCVGNTRGICAPGSQTCINGTSWSSCVNQTLPLSSDLCNNNLDDDCDGQTDEGCQQQQNQTPQTQTTCFNSVQDGDETGVDCGGSCRVCTSCTDGILNQGEYKTSVDLGNNTVSDCGGPNCPSCPTCSDGIKNQGETNIDCGGPCQACQQQTDQVDEDGDGLTLAVELTKGTDPLLKDTDKDGVHDKQDKMPLCPNLVCDTAYGEDEESCPEDCAEESSFGIVLLILFVLLLGVGGYFYYQFKKTGKTFTASSKKEPQEPLYISKELLNDKQDTNQKSKIDKDLEKSFQKAEKYFK